MAMTLLMHAYHLTVHWLHILMEYIPAVAEFKSNSNLVTDLHDLALCKALATCTSVHEKTFIIWIVRPTQRPSTSVLVYPNLCLGSNP
jgi:hypothetical protein